jgi:hypothetical protein
VTVSPPTTTYSPDLSFWQIGREKAAPATAATTFFTMPTAAYAPDDKPQWLQDKALRNSFVKTYDLNQGPIWAEHSVPQSPLFGDTIGMPIYGLFGDYVTTGTATTPTWTTSGALSPGAGPIAVGTGTAATAATYIQIDSAQNSEVVKVGTGSTSTSIVVDASTPIRFSHLTSIAITTVTGPYTHQFALLGPASSTGNVSGEPPSMTINHCTGIPGSGNNNAVQYLYGCFSELTFSGKASDWLSWEGKLTSYSHAYPGSAPVAAFSGTRAQPAWNTVQTIGGTAANGITDWSGMFTRDMDVIPTADGQQSPYGIFRGGMDATFKLTYNPVIDETALLKMLNNTRPTLNWTISNGQSGTSEVSFSIAAQLAGYKGATLKPQKTRWGWDVTGEFVGNSTNVGNSGGYGPAVITLINNIPTY